MNSNRYKRKQITKVKGQLLLWRTGFGCDLVEYVKDNENMYGDYCQVLMHTGILRGELNSFNEYSLRNTTKEIYERYKRLYF